jgi:hypothetical protein
MKYHQTHFEDYVNTCQKRNLHPNYEKIYAEHFPKSLQTLKNIIFYGPAGIGKYTQMLYSIKKYSPSELKYEKKISLVFNKQQYFFKISDIHFEIDVSLLGCNAKLLWHEIFSQIVDAISAKPDKTGIIVCKNFHDIHNELLDNFYSYMQQNNFNGIHIKFILISEELSFIPDNILNCCQLISFARPKKAIYTNSLDFKIPSNVEINNITNIKNLRFHKDEIMNPHKMICNKIINQMIIIKESNELKLLKFRDVLYDIFIYNLNITHCIWYLVTELITKEKIKRERLGAILISTFSFLQYFNNNYRPIYHLEKFLLGLVQEMI